MGENALGGGGMSPADMAAVMGNGDGWGNNSWWIVVLFMALWGGNGFGWGNNRGYQPQYATQDFVQNGFNFNDLQDQNRDLMAAITGGTAQAVQATTQAKYDNINVAKDIQAALAAQIGDVRSNQMQLMANQNECCCNTLRAIDGVKYENAMNTAAIQQAIAAEGQATRGMIQENKIEALRDRVNSLELQNAMNGVVRYPDSFSYNAGANPFCGCGQPVGCCNI